MRVGVYGGSFDPPHLGHAFVTLWALSTCPVDEVWWVPTWQHAFGKRSAPYDDRMRYCQRATRHLQNVRVDDVERTLGGESRTIDTLEALEARYPEVAFSLVIGADLVAELPRWKRWEDLQRYPIHAVGRGETGVDGVPVAVPNVSSTALRGALAAGDYDAARGWLDEAVLADIRQGGAYR